MKLTETQKRAYHSIGNAIKGIQSDILLLLDEAPQSAKIAGVSKLSRTLGLLLGYVDGIVMYIQEEGERSDNNKD